MDINKYYYIVPSKSNQTINDEYILDYSDNTLYAYYNFKGYHKIDPNMFHTMYLLEESYEKIKKLIKLDYTITKDKGFVILKLNKDMEINSYPDLKKYIEGVKLHHEKKKLLLHSCCGPCSSHVLDFLHEYFDITIFYQNSNIDTYDEYKYRLKTQIKIANKIDESIEVIDDIYDSSIYDKYTLEHKDKKERSIRCYNCYYFRMEMCAKYAKEHNFDYFTTTLSISPHKVESWINEIGNKLQEQYGIKYIYSNFKLDGGYLHSIELSKLYDLYRQDYCGCKYSKVEKNHKN